LGLFDTHGNNWEWCQGVYDKAVDDSDNQPTIEPKESHVLRCGLYLGLRLDVPSAYCSSDQPSDHYLSAGFQLAKALFSRLIIDAAANCNWVNMHPVLETSDRGG
jgi:formylglycine-generating enzyme required for sulfatase activity